MGGPDWQPPWRLLSLFCVSGTPPAFAAPDSTPASRDQIEDRRQALLRLMLQDPTNLDVAFEYAALSSQVGDYEAAVSTLERMLIFAPNTPRLELELGILATRSRAAISRKWSPIRMSRPKLPRRCGSICNSSPSRLSLRPSAPRSSAAFAGREMRTEPRLRRPSP